MFSTVIAEIYGLAFWLLVMNNVSGGSNSEPQTPAQPIDYNFAREELMLKELSNDPIQAAIQNLERQHEEDKQSRLLALLLALLIS